MVSLGRQRSGRDAEMHDHDRDRLVFEMTLAIMKRIGCEMYLTAGAGVMVCLEHPDIPEHEHPVEGICPFARREAEALLRIHDGGRWPAYLEALTDCAALLEGRAVPS